MDSGRSGLRGIPWKELTEVVTHVLTAHPAAAASPPLHSQLFVSSRVPCYLRWAFPPFLCDSSTHKSIIPPLLRWSLSFLLLSRARTMGFPRSSWRSSCPFQQPPPAVTSAALPPLPSRRGLEERRTWVRQRLMRRRLGLNVPPFFVVVAPNLLLLLLLHAWDPLVP